MGVLLLKIKASENKSVEREPITSLGAHWVQKAHPNSFHEDILECAGRGEGLLSLDKVTVFSALADIWRIVCVLARNGP